MTTAAIELVNVSCKFVSPEDKTTLALKDFSLRVSEGNFYTIVGATGCGKSTTPGMITGLSPPTSGQVRVFGKPFTGIHPDIGFVFQADAVFLWNNVIDNLAAGPRYCVESAKVARDMAAGWVKLAVVALAAEYLLTALENRLLKWRPAQFVEQDISRSSRS